MLRHPASSAAANNCGHSEEENKGFNNAVLGIEVEKH